MPAPTKNPAKRCNADGAVNAESLQGNHSMSLASSARSEQTPPVQPNHIKHGDYGMFSEKARHAAMRNPDPVCAYPFMNFVDATADIANGVNVILCLATHADLERSGYEDGGETDAFLRDYDKSALLHMAKTSMLMLTHEAERLAEWANNRTEGESHD